jgi:glutathionylspermidine synthase
MTQWVRKPLLGREGANITLHGSDEHVETGGDYGQEGYVYQELAPLRPFQGRFPVIGSWVIGEQEGAVAGGIGIRESESPIITNTSRFVPHLFM